MAAAGFRRILVLVPEEAGPCGAVLARAAALARPPGTELRLLAVTFSVELDAAVAGDSPELRAARAAHVESRAEQLRERAEPLAAAGLAVSVHALWGEAVAELCAQEAREWAAGLVVVGGAGGGADQPHGSLLRELVRLSPVSVLVTGAAGGCPWQWVLAAVDASGAGDAPGQPDVRVLELADQLAREHGIGLRVLHCYTPAQPMPLVAPGAAVGAIAHRGSSTVERHTAALDGLLQRQGIRHDRLEVVNGDPRRAIPEQARSRPGCLLLVGAANRGRVSQLLLGSTAEAVLSRVSCDVLVSRPALQSPEPV